MKIKFTKMQGCGNDYIYIDCFKQEINNPEQLSIDLADRHFGIGGDGIVLICPSEVADAKMRMFNADGSEGKMCGNAIRCIGKYLFDNGYVKTDEVRIDTLSGIKTLKLQITNNVAVGATVNMGKAILNSKDIPVIWDKNEVINEKFIVDNTEYHVTCVSMGNPHCISYCDDVDAIELEKIGPKFENNSIFPEKINTEFVQIIDENTIKMRVWERGSGETLACGTGACACAVATVLNGLSKIDTEMTVQLKGGDLVIKYCEDGTVFMTGPATKVFEGEVTHD
jgi:diaminopimelate epimerase